MTEPEYIYTEHGFPIKIQNGGMRRFKQYTRNGKRFWRNYNRDVAGGCTILGVLADKMNEAKRAMMDALAVNIYSSNNTDVEK